MKKILLTILVLVTVGVGVAVGFTLWHRYNPPIITDTAPSPTNAIPSTTTRTPDTAPSNSVDTSLNAPGTPPTAGAGPTGTGIQKPPETTSTDMGEISTPTVSQTLPSKSKDAYLPLSKVDCEQGCKRYSAEKQLRYCQEYCGLATPLTDDDCSSLKDLEQDYCYKDRAIATTDPTLCKRVDDANIRTTCQNRITEDIVDRSKQSPKP